jgi:hypothetical protein
MKPKHYLDTLPVAWAAPTPGQKPDSVPSDIPYSTHEGLLDIGGTLLRCHQLSNGERVFRDPFTATDIVEDLMGSDFEAIDWQSHAQKDGTGLQQTHDGVLHRYGREFHAYKMLDGDYGISADEIEAFVKELQGAG